MFDPQQKSTGTRYTLTAALLSIAVLFIPAMLVVSRPFGLVSVSLAITCSALCVGLAWINWKKNSDLTIPSIVSPSPRP
jgi:hypothetical protein